MQLKSCIVNLFLGFMIKVSLTWWLNAVLQTVNVSLKKVQMLSKICLYLVLFSSTSNLLFATMYSMIRYK